MIPNTVLMNCDVADEAQRDDALRQWGRIMAELGMPAPFLAEPPFHIEVVARGALGGKTEVITIITREFRRT